MNIDHISAIFVVMLVITTTGCLFIDFKRKKK